MTRPSPNPSPQPANSGLLVIIGIILGIVADTADILDRFKGLFPTKSNPTPVAVPSPTRENQTATNTYNATPFPTKRNR
ncbi:MAG: hypothetical protein F6K39_21815, partial [Okeania sp. SIO3B3]|nr:hypothetical protein [Okeania sp. SIO3B3]